MKRTPVSHILPIIRNAIRDATFAGFGRELESPKSDISQIFEGDNYTSELVMSWGLPEFESHVSFEVHIKLRQTEMDGDISISFFWPIAAGTKWVTIKRDLTKNDADLIKKKISMIIDDIASWRAHQQIRKEGGYVVKFDELSGKC